MCSSNHIFFPLFLRMERVKVSSSPFLVPKRQFSTRTARDSEATPRMWKCAIATIYTFPLFFTDDFFLCFYLWKGWRSPPAHFWSPNGNFLFLHQFLRALFCKPHGKNAIKTANKAKLFIVFFRFSSVFVFFRRFSNFSSVFNRVFFVSISFYGPFFVNALKKTPLKQPTKLWT